MKNTCPKCGTAYNVNASVVGRKFTCKNCGTPVIVTDHSAMPELCGAGWVVGGDDWYNATQGSFYKCPSIDELVEAMEAAYEARGDQQLRDQARDFAAAYDADRVTSEFWVPALERLAEFEAPPKALQPLGNAA